MDRNGRINTAIGNEIAAIRSEARGFERMKLAIRNIRPGDVIVSNGRTVAQMFDSLYDPKADDNNKVQHFISASTVLVQYEGNPGISVLYGEVKGLSDRLDCIEVFRPVAHAL